MNHYTRLLDTGTQTLQPLSDVSFCAMQLLARYCPVMRVSPDRLSNRKRIMFPSSEEASISPGPPKNGVNAACSDEFWKMPAMFGNGMGGSAWCTPAKQANCDRKTQRRRSPLQNRQADRAFRPIPTVSESSSPIVYVRTVYIFSFSLLLCVHVSQDIRIEGKIYITCNTLLYTCNCHFIIRYVETLLTDFNERIIKYVGVGAGPTQAPNNASS